MTADEFRGLALSLPEAVEGAHVGHPDFRVRGKIFATLEPAEDWGMVKLTADQQALFVRTEPGVFQPVNGGWGRRGRHPRPSGGGDRRRRPSGPGRRLAQHGPEGLGRAARRVASERVAKRAALEREGVRRIDVGKVATAGMHVALIRGINVGRAKRVAMAELREAVAALGYGGVRTLLNSGNVVFTAPPRGRGRCRRPHREGDGRAARRRRPGHGAHRRRTRRRRRRQPPARGRRRPGRACSSPS